MNDRIARPSDARKKGQSAVEAIALLAGMLIMLLAVAVVMPGQLGELNSESGRAGAQLAADTLAQAADEVYLAGDGAKKTVFVDMPETYDGNRSFVGNREPTGSIYSRKTIGLYVIGYGDVIAESRAPICGRLPQSPGRHRLTLEYNASGHVMLDMSC